MNNFEKENWLKIKKHFETLPDFKRDNFFYKRACTICNDLPDPIEHPSLSPE